MLTNKTDLEANQLSAAERKRLDEELRLEELKDTEETARLLEDAVINGNTKELTSLIVRNANINSQFLTPKFLMTSLLALTIRHKKPETLQRLLMFGYLITKEDIEQIEGLISDEFQKKGGPGKQSEDGLTILHTFKAHVKPMHFCGMPMPNIFDSDAFLGAINSAIAALSPAPSSSASTTNNTVKPALLHAFQPVDAADAATFGTNMLFSLITSQEFDRFRDLLKSLITNAAFDINALDKEGKTLLHHASINVNKEFLRVLLENKANPNIGDKYGWTPVHCSAFTGKNFDVFMKDSTADSIPINWNAKTQSKKGEGKTILQLAVQSKKIPQKDLDLIRLKIPNTTESKNPGFK